MEPVLLSPVENYFWRFEKDMNGAFRAAILIRVEGVIHPEYLAAALLQLQRRHPKLRAAIAEGSDGRLRYHFKNAAPPIPIKIVDCRGEDTGWREETRLLLQEELPDAGPLATVSVLRPPSRRTSELILTVSHAIADGVSAMTLIDDLLTEYASAESQRDTLNTTLPVVTALRARGSSSWGDRFHVLRRFVRLKRDERRLATTSLPTATGITPHSQWVHWVFTREQTVTLVRRCRKERTSLTGAMIAAACCGIMECLATSGALFRWQVPFNLRDVLVGSDGPVTSYDLGCFVTNMNGVVSTGHQPAFWELARQVQDDIQMFTRRGGPAFGYNVAAFFYELACIFRSKLRRPAAKLIPSTEPRATILATNYGVPNILEEYGSLRPKECTVTFKNDVTGPALIMEALVVGQRLNLGFAGDDLEPAFWGRLQLEVRKHLDAAAAQEFRPQSADLQAAAIAGS